MRPIVAAFGEAERGPFYTPLYVRSLPELLEKLGNPKGETQGLFFAVQALFYDHEILFFRVKEEGFSKEDYFFGLHLLENKELIKEFHCLSLPGVGDQEILDLSFSLCKKRKSLLFLTEKDLYDYMTTQG